MTNQENNKTKNSILEKIKKEDVRVRSKLYFSIKTIFLASFVIILFLLTTYLISFVLFFTKTRGILFLSSFGLYGFKMIFGNLPWLIIFLTLVLIVVLIAFAERFSLVYKRPIVYSLIFLVTLAVFVATFVENSSIHSHMMYSKPMSNEFHYGTILEMTRTGFFMKDIENNIVRVTIKNKAPLLFCEELRAGDRVMIIGDRVGDEVGAEKIKKVE